ncbi:hypothetical protein LEM8419_01699 [Neolewinella maritima]|uniref:Uncharacterized protein n=1 Tax=Neolewinella maritima TaxID=1383882 RepID=A0ABN8F429_9BACT|nr:hypothetical protein LEM8419_01699 [Neolewinella maritima]
MLMNFYLSPSPSPDERGDVSEAISPVFSNFIAA